MDTRGRGPIREETVLYKGGWGEEKLENLQTDKQAKNNQTDKEFKHWGHSNPLWILGVAGQ